MKSLIITLNFILVCACFVYGKSPENLGVVNQLIEIKYISEAYLSSVFENPASTEKQKKLALESYNQVRLQLDRIIYQMIAEIRIKNSIKLFKKVNKHYKYNLLSEANKSPNCIKLYIQELNNAYITFERNVNPKVNGNVKTMIEFEAAISILEFGWTIIKDINEMKGNKVEGVVEVLNNLRLNTPAEIIKKDK